MYWKKVSFEAFKSDLLSTSDDDFESIEEIYNNIQLPSRATAHSGGYDIRSPISCTLAPGDIVAIPTGVSFIPENLDEEEQCLLIFPRSSFGIKKHGRLLNSVAVIDADYYKAKNEGDIILYIQNFDNHLFLSIDAGERIMQGVLVYYNTMGEEINTERDGGIGSTGI